MEITLKLIHGTTFVKAKQKCYNNVASSFPVQPLKTTFQIAIFTSNFRELCACL